MKRRQFLSKAGALSALAVFSPSVLHSQQQLRTVGINSNVLNASFDFQDTPVWCWAACIQLSLRLYGVEISQAEIVQRTFGAVIPTTGSWINITNNLNYVGQDSSGADVIISGSVFRGSPSGEVVVNHLEESKPIIMAYQNPQTFAGHAVVVTGVDYEVVGSRIAIRNIYLRDPFPYSPQHVANNGRLYGPNSINPTHTWFVDASQLT